MYVYIDNILQNLRNFLLLRCCFSAQWTTPSAYQTKSIRSRDTGRWMHFCLGTISALNSEGSDYERMSCAKWLHHPFQQWELTDSKKRLTLNFLFQRREFNHNPFSFLLPQSAEMVELVKMWVWRVSRRCWTILDSSEAMVSSGETPLERRGANWYDSLAV